jgi:AraC-like DNA-binding protein
MRLTKTSDSLAPAPIFKLLFCSGSFRKCIACVGEIPILPSFERRYLPNETKRMTESGTTTFTSPDDYQAGIGGAAVNLVLADGGHFKARLTWLKLRHLHLLRCCEDVPRIAYVSLTPARVFVSFPVSSNAPVVWSGVELRANDIVFHSRGERIHQWTKGASRWGLFSLPPAQLAICGMALTGLEIISPPAGRILRPPRPMATHLQRLFSKACHIVETKPELLAPRETARAFEQELLHALVSCLAADDICDKPARKRHHADIMIRFEDALAAHVGRRFSTPELCAVIGVPERTLRVCCAEFLGMSPGRYLRLRRLNMVRAELRRADPATANVAEIAQRHQFSELGRFAATYRAVFGEKPSDTLRHGAIRFA